MIEYIGLNYTGNLVDIITSSTDLSGDLILTADAGFTITTAKMKFNYPRTVDYTYDLMDVGILDGSILTVPLQDLKDLMDDVPPPRGYWRYIDDMTDQSITVETVSAKNVNLDLEGCYTTEPIPFIEDWTGEIVITADEGRIFNTAQKYFQFWDDGSYKDNFNLDSFISANGRELIINLADFLIETGKTAEKLSGYDNQGLLCRTVPNEGFIVDKINFDLENCTVDNDERITNRDDYINIIADDGFIMDYLMIGLKNPRSTASEYNILNLFLSGDKTQVNIYLPDLYNELPFSPSTITNATFQIITAKAIEHITVDDDVFKSNDFLKTYIGDFDTLYDISILMYGENLGGVDIMNTIQSIYSLPFKFDEDLIIPTQRLIFFGNVESDVLANLTNVNTLIVNFGIVEVPVLYDSLFDYKDTDCFIHLPFLSNPIDVDAYKIVGHKVHARLFIDLYTGEGTYILTSDSVDNQIIFKQVVKVGYEIPIVNIHRNVILGTLDKFNYNLDYEFKIEVNRNIPIFTNEKSNLIYDKIENYSGVVKVNDTQLMVNCSNTEKDEIRNLLTTGIII